MWPEYCLHNSFLDPERLVKGIFRSQFFRPYVLMYVWKFSEIQFIEKLNYGTPHMTIYGAQVNRK